MPSRNDPIDRNMTGRARPATEISLVILYILNRFDELTDAHLLDFVTEEHLMSYMDLMPALARLTEDGAVKVTPEGPYRRYALEAPGRDLLNLYGNRIPFSVRRTVDGRVPEWQAELKTQRDYRADMAQTPRGDFEVSLRLMERGHAAMSVMICLPSSEMAARLCRQWQTRGSEVFMALMKPLLEDDMP